MYWLRNKKIKFSLRTVSSECNSTIGRLNTFKTFINTCCPLNLECIGMVHLDFDSNSDMAMLYIVFHVEKNRKFSVLNFLTLLNP